MAESKKEEGNWFTNHWAAWGLLGVVGYLVVTGAYDDVDQFTESNDTGLKRRLAQATAENNSLEKQNTELKKQIAEFDKKYQSNIDRLEDKIKEMQRAQDDRFDERVRGRYREDWRGDYRRPPYYGRPPFNPYTDYRWYGAGGGPAYPIEYGRPYGSPYRTPWWDDRIYQRPFGYGQHPYSYGPQYGGGRSVRFGFDSRGAFNFGYQGERFGVRFGGRF